MTPTQKPISLAEAAWRGFRMRCPNCGTGKLFGRYLKVVDRCAVCGEAFSHHRADDFPAYLVMLVVGHAIVPMILAVETNYAPPTWLQLSIWLPAMVISALALLQPTKGAIVGWQWQLGMHGFEPSSTAGWPRSRRSLARARFKRIQNLVERRLSEQIRFRPTPVGGT